MVNMESNIFFERMMEEGMVGLSGAKKLVR